MNIRRFALLLLPFTVTALFADVTVRYKSEMKLGVSIPGAPDAQKTLDKAVPPETTLLEKDGKTVSGMMGGFTAITDFNTNKVVLLDRTGKRYARIDGAHVGEVMGGAMPQMPAGVGALMDSMKMNVSEPKLTGRTETIQGIEAEEQQMEMTVDGPAMPGLPPGPMIREVFQVWTAKQSEILRSPAVRELMGYTLWSMATTNPIGQLTAMMGQMMPGMGDVVTSMQKTMQKGIFLRMNIAMYMPGLAPMLQQMQAANNTAAPKIDPNAPLMQMSQELVEISSAAIPASQFEIPAGFQEVQAADLVKDMVPKAAAAAAAVPAK